MQSNKTKRRVIESAEHSLAEAERQFNLGSECDNSDMAYWAAYLDGASAQKKEDDRWWNNLIANAEKVHDDK